MRKMNKKIWGSVPTPEPHHTEEKTVLDHLKLAGKVWLGALLTVGIFGGVLYSFIHWPLLTGLLGSFTFVFFLTASGGF